MSQRTASAVRSSDTQWSRTCSRYLTRRRRSPMTADNQLVHWGRASINWTPHGYDLLVEASVFGKRAADIMLRELQASTEEWDMRWHVSPGEIERTSAGSTAHFTLIELHSPKLFALDPDHLRAAM